MYRPLTCGSGVHFQIQRYLPLALGLPFESLLSTVRIHSSLYII